jgi:superfamily II DNA/RNA helicase
MQTNTSNFGERISLPDSWQRKALGFLRDGLDVVLHAPTGAGKTYVFEQLLERGWKGRAVYTVPTRALANDKFREWKKRGWEVGLSTGDLRYRTDARVVVATLETQRSLILRGSGPDLFVVDEYQMLGDQQRGPGYEITLGMAPSSVQLLLMSGSVANPVDVADWLSSHGRSVELVTELVRPVPLDEVFSEALLKRPFRGRKVRGHWPKLVAGALSAGLGPLLLFAPRRKAAEDLARQLATELPVTDGLELTSEQKKIAGKELSGLLKRRIAYHHSGLDYQSRAGVVEPLAKAGQLQVVVATTGLGSGINFSMRSVLVTDREYRVEDGLRLLRPDELLQMFGRAGRRGLDDRGFVIVTPKQPRMGDARPLKLKRSQTLDWPAILRVMHYAHERGDDHLDAARGLAHKLFSEENIRLGLRDSINKIAMFAGSGQIEKKDIAEESERNEVIEMRNSTGLWERRGGQCQAPLGETYALHKGEWVKALTLPDTLGKVNVGNPCRFGSKKNPVYGREVPVGVYDKESEGKHVTLTKSFRKQLRQTVNEKYPHLRKKFSRKTWRRNGLEKVFHDLFPSLTMGGDFEEFVDRGGVLRVRLRYENATVLGWKDARGKILLNPPLRKTTRVFDSPFREKKQEDLESLSALSPAEVWAKLGLIDSMGVPTQRGVIFSFFSRGEGLAVAVGLEDESYPIDEFVYDLANLRAGHRFRAYAKTESRLSLLCREVFGFKNCPGYLKDGLPVEYGEGATEAIRDHEGILSSQDSLSEDLSIGDIERILVEWKSLLSLIAHSPGINSDRWQALREAARSIVGDSIERDHLPELPELPHRQKDRFQQSSQINFV